MTWPRQLHNTSMQILEVENFACDPRKQILRLCNFLGLEPHGPYLAAAAARVDVSFCNATGERTMKARKQGFFKAGQHVV